MKKIVRSFSLPENVVEVLENDIPSRKMSDYIAKLILKDRVNRLIEKTKKPKSFAEIARISNFTSTKVKNTQDILDAVEKGRV